MEIRLLHLNFNQELRTQSSQEFTSCTVYCLCHKFSAFAPIKWWFSLLFSKWNNASRGIFISFLISLRFVVAETCWNGSATFSTFLHSIDISYCKKYFLWIVLCTFIITLVMLLIWRLMPIGLSWFSAALACKPASSDWHKYIVNTKLLMFGIYLTAIYCYKVSSIR